MGFIIGGARLSDLGHDLSSQQPPPVLREHFSDRKDLGFLDLSTSGWILEVVPSVTTDTCPLLQLWKAHL